MEIKIISLIFLEREFIYYSNKYFSFFFLKKTKIF
jgi:hypothetical protein